MCILGTTQLLKPWHQIGHCHPQPSFHFAFHVVIAIYHSNCENPVSQILDTLEGNVVQSHWRNCEVSWASSSCGIQQKFNITVLPLQKLKIFWAALTYLGSVWKLQVHTLYKGLIVTKGKVRILKEERNFCKEDLQTIQQNFLRY